MSTYGLTATGFEVKPLEQILLDIQATQLSKISASLDVQATALIGVANGIVAAAIYELWLLAAALYNGMDPDQAVDDQLASLALITGTLKLAATSTQVLAVTVNVDPGTYNAGTLFANVIGNKTALFVNKTDVVNGGGAAANRSVDFEALTPGPTQCLSATLTERAIPVTGWNSVTNPTDGVVGRGTETDPDLRLRRDQELAAAGSSTAAAIKGAVLKQLVPPLTTSETLNCTVLYNDSDVTDANGLPPHSIEVIAYQPGNTSADDIALATLILNAKAAGIATYSGAGTYKDITDSQGNVERVYYTRPTPTRLYAAITVLTDPLTFPTNGAALVKAALANYASGVDGNPGEYAPGSDAYVKPLQGQVFTNPNDPNVGVKGVLDVPTFLLDTVTPPVASANISIDIRHIATLATGDITVTVTP